ncbi:MAG: MFS transporter [Isosphaeraceae bacterium]|nr:MFS transporter [Isosphaeraceae bacterium]
MRFARTFAALANVDYRRYYLGQGISLIGSWLQAAAVSWIVYDRTRSERMLGLVEAAGVVPGLVVGLFAGALADRVRPRRMILSMQIAQMALAFLLAWIVAADIEPVVAPTALIVALTRVFVTFEMPSRQVLLHRLVGREGLLNAIALNSGLFNASRVVGPALAGICLARLGEPACFALNGASYLAAIAALLAIRRIDDPSDVSLESRGGRPAPDWFGGLRYVRSDRVTALLFGLVIAMGVVGMGYSALAASYARRTIGTLEAGYSMLLAGAGVGATIGALVVAGRSGTRRPDRILIGGIVLFSVALAGCALLPPLAGPTGSLARLATALVCLTAVGFGAVAFYASAQMMIQHRVPDALRGRVMGIWMIAYSGSVPLGCLWAGELAARTDVPTVMLVSALACLAIALGVEHGGRLRPGPSVSESATAQCEAGTSAQAAFNIRPTDATIDSSTSFDQDAGRP